MDYMPNMTQTSYKYTQSAINFNLRKETQF